MPRYIRIQPGLYRDRTVLWMESPYHPRMPAKARSLGGKWDERAHGWRFDLRDEERVLALARELYGTDGRSPVELVTVQVVGARLYKSHGRYWFAGIAVLRWSYRSNCYYPEDGSIIVGGGADNEGAVDLIVEIRDVPEPLVQREMSANHSGIAIVDTRNEILDQNPVGNANRTPLDELYRQICQLPEPEQVEIRNRLLRDL